MRIWFARFASVSLDTTDPLLDPPTADPAPDVALIAHEFERAIGQVVRSLPRRLRDPFLLAASGDHRYQEIATLLGTPVGTVKWRISEARRLIRAKLERLGHGGAQ